MADETTVKAAKLTEVAIEVASPKNNGVLWPVTHEQLRGRWDRSNLYAVTMAQEMQAMPTLPGMLIGVDPIRRKAYIRDPLNDPKNREILLKAQQVHLDCFKTQAGPAKGAEYEDLDETSVKTWLYWMRRLVNNNLAQVAKGNLPELDEIARLPGKTRTELHNSSPRCRKFLEDPDPV